MDIEVERMERMRVHVEPEVEGGAKIEEEKEQDSLVPIGVLRVKGEEWLMARGASRASNPPPNFRPTRKVRDGESSVKVVANGTAPGGKSSMGEACGSIREGVVSVD